MDQPRLTTEPPFRLLNHTLSGDPRRPAILFLHGFLGSSRDWDATITALGERFYCIAVDLPGHGASLNLPSDGYTMEGASRYLTDLLDSLDVRRAVIVGYSMGGRLALYFALRHSERCSGLFLESASPGLESPQERNERRRTDEEKATRLESGNFDEFLHGWYQQPLFASLAKNGELLQKTIESRRRNEPGELALSLRGMGTGSQPSLWGEIAGLRPPALAVAGELDEKFVGIGRRMGSHSPKIRFAEVARMGHNAHIETPKAYLNLLRDFLESL